MICAERWRRIQYWDSAYEETLAEEFDSYIDAFYAKRREFYQSAQKLKEELIEQARKVDSRALRGIRRPKR